jgi:hypothetical protein
MAFAVYSIVGSGNRLDCHRWVVEEEYMIDLPYRLYLQNRVDVFCRPLLLSAA